MPDITKQGRSHDASVVIENLEGKSIEEARTELTKLETSQVNDVRGLVDQLLEPDHDEDRQRYGAIKQAADMVYGEKLEGREDQLLTDQAVETALKPLELAEELAESEKLVEGVETETLWQQPAAKAQPRIERMAETAAKAAPPAEEVETLEGEHGHLNSQIVTAWLEKYGVEQVKQGLLSMFAVENKKTNITPEKLERFLYALKNNPEKLPSEELDEIRLELDADVSSEVVADVLKDRIANDKSPLPEVENAA